MSDFQYSQDYVIYKAKKECAYPIKVSDWDRLKRIIKGVIPNRRIFQILSSIFFGLFASAVFSVITFHGVSNLDSWIMPTLWIIFWVSLIGGVALLILDSIQKSLIEYSTNDVITEMLEIERTFEVNSEQVN